jgi:hypothetical protein
MNEIRYSTFRYNRYIHFVHCERKFIVIHYYQSSWVYAKIDG